MQGTGFRCVSVHVRLHVDLYLIAEAEFRWHEAMFNAEDWTVVNMSRRAA